MINLLPPEMKQGYSYARRNVTLRRWLVACVFAFIGLGLIATLGLLTLHQSNTHYNKEIATNAAVFKQEKFAETQSQVKDVSNNFKLVVKVLSQEVLFSQLIQRIGATMPTNANLTGLNINQAQAAIDITAVATDSNTATQVQINLADPANKIFSKADIINVTCSSTNALDPKYPCTVAIRALFASNNPFLFINSKATTP